MESVLVWYGMGHVLVCGMQQPHDARSHRGQHNTTLNSGMASAKTGNRHRAGLLSTWRRLALPVIPKPPLLLDRSQIRVREMLEDPRATVAREARGRRVEAPRATAGPALLARVGNNSWHSRVSLVVPVIGWGDLRPVCFPTLSMFSSWCLVIIPGRCWCLLALRRTRF